MELHLDNFPTHKKHKTSEQIFSGKYTLICENYLNSERRYYIWVKIITCDGKVIFSYQAKYHHIFHHEININNKEYLLIGTPLHNGILINLTEETFKMVSDNFNWMEGAISPDERTIIVGGDFWGEEPIYLFYDISGDKVVAIESDTITYLRYDGDIFTEVKWLDNTTVEIITKESYYPHLQLTLSEIIAEKTNKCFGGDKFDSDTYQLVCKELEELDRQPCVNKIVDRVLYHKVNNKFVEMFGEDNSGK